MLLWLLACGRADPPAADPLPPPPPAPRPVLQPARVERLREVLRARLGEAYDRPVEGLATSSPARGQAVYDAHCASCHGLGGQGDGLDPARPWDFTDPTFRGAYSEAGRVSAIRDGLPGTDMPGFEGQLSDQEVLDAYDFVRNLRSFEELQ